MSGPEFLPTFSFDYKRGKEWRDLYAGAELVISHAGAGSCLEALENGTRLLGMGRKKVPIAREKLFLLRFLR